MASALQFRPYRLYAIGNTISLIGTWMQRLVVGWLTWELTGSGVWLGLIAFADLFPTVVLAPIAGTIADSHDRLKIMRMTQLAALVQAVLLVALSAVGLLNEWILLALTLIFGIAMGIDQPARLAFVSSLIPRDNLPSAVAINSITFNVARFIGPAVGGALLAWNGPVYPFALNAVTYVIFIVILFRIVLPNFAPDQSHKGQSFFSRLRSGIEVVLVHPGLRVIFVLLICLTLGVRPITEMLPGFADAVFEVGAGGLAMMTAAMGLGSVVGGLWINSATLASNLSKSILTNSFILAVAVTIYLLTTELWIALPCLFFASFGISRTAITAQTTVHLSVEENVRGRVLGLYGMVFRGCPALGALIMGLASVHLGLRLPIFFGVIGLCFGWIWVFRKRHIAAESLGRSWQKQNDVTRM